MWLYENKNFELGPDDLSLLNVHVSYPHDLGRMYYILDVALSAEFEHLPHLRRMLLDFANVLFIFLMPRFLFPAPAFLPAFF